MLEPRRSPALGTQPPSHPASPVDVKKQATPTPPPPPPPPPTTTSCKHCPCGPVCLTGSLSLSLSLSCLAQLVGGTQSANQPSCWVRLFFSLPLLLLQLQQLEHCFCRLFVCAFRVYPPPTLPFCQLLHSPSRLVTIPYYHPHPHHSSPVPVPVLRTPHPTPPDPTRAPHKACSAFFPTVTARPSPGS
ncbi:hypothetical protein Mp_7g16860 [Marchantia polymorpha subsp. ruderalis]|uniref:Uncharacterized protein n=2 Tax=Marchantia polymorpha TaxID=3197 RepID=A0AAF6C0I3_MARPO|nr:hypothetical protein MARPO_0051s0024 [Marchantia polymorpha]BBN17767.1 hypothetical protein Mp_7g16860 [Marchantia polymorpha subsp. ruderalis]|eukprot:PTQ38393.1 hypothetical protein MARPO_0051s0024 [Marchantia polymorpha]